MTISDENLTIFQKFGEFCKNYWNIRGPPSEFCDKIMKEFPIKDIEMVTLFFLQKVGENPKEFNTSTCEYMLSIISDDPSIVFANLDLNNQSLVIGARKVVEMIKIESFNALPVYSEKSANTVLNALLVVLMNENKAELKRDVLQLSQFPYFCILISSGRLFSSEKYKSAQMLFKENNPFDVPIRQLPMTQAYLAIALFPGNLIEPLYANDKFRNLFFLFAVFQLVILDNTNVKILLTDSTSACIFNYFTMNYLVCPSYILSFYLINFPHKHFNSKNIIKMNDLRSSFEENDYYEDYNSDHFLMDSNDSSNSSSTIKYSQENILNFFYEKGRSDQNQKYFVFNSDIIHEILPNGILPTYDKALDFLTLKPDSFSIDTLIDDALNYPSFTSEIANIFMMKLKEKNIADAVNLANQILKRVEDIRITWIAQQVFFPIMTSLYECLNEIYDEYQFEVLLFLFFSFYEGCTSQGDEEILKILRKFNSNFDEQFRLYLDNFLNQTEELIISNDIDVNDQRPIKKLIAFLNKCIERNDVDSSDVMKCPYLFLSAFIWGIKTIHPNSFKLLTLKFPKYKILKKFFVHLSCCQRSKKDQELKESSNFIFNVSSFYFSFDLLTRFPPTNEEGIRLIILQHLQQISMPETGIKQVEGIIISWRAWMKIFSIEKFVLILIETIIWAGGSKLDQMKTRNSFLYAERLLATVFLNSIKTSMCISLNDQKEFNFDTKKFERKSVDNSNNNADVVDLEYNNKIDQSFRIAIWTALEFVNNYQGEYSDGIGIASFCLLLNISMKNDWKSEFKQMLEFSNKMLKESNWKSLKNSFGTNLLFLSLSILDIHDLIRIDMFDFDFLQMNWRFGISFFFIKSAFKRLKKLNLIP